MATEVELGGKLELTAIAADWDYRASKPASWPIYPSLLSISFHPGAADDKLVVKHQSDGGPTIMNVTCENAYDDRIEYFHGTKARPYIDFSASVFSAGHKVIMQLWRK
jgi:hypothetical protein